MFSLTPEALDAVRGEQGEAFEFLLPPWRGDGLVAGTILRFRLMSHTVDFLLSSTRYSALFDTRTEFDAIRVFSYSCCSTFKTIFMYGESWRSTCVDGGG